MPDFLIDVLTLRALGLTKLLRRVVLIVLLGSLIAGFIYFAVVLHAVQERSRGHHVHTHSTR